MSLDELAEILGDELQLPRIEPKGESNITEEKHRYNTIRSTGPDSLQTLQAVLREGIAAANCDRKLRSCKATCDPRSRDDMRYRSYTSIPQPQAAAAIIYMMDVSGSMTDEQKAVVRTEAFWIDTWLQSQYDGIERRYIVHDALAKVVDEHTFYHTRESGGTRISSAYRVCADLDRQRVPGRRLEHLLLPVFRWRQLGRRQQILYANPERERSCRFATCFVTDKSTARTEAATTSSHLAKHLDAEHEKDNSCPKSLTATGSTNRFERFWGLGK